MPPFYVLLVRKYLTHQQFIFQGKQKHMLYCNEFQSFSCFSGLRQNLRPECQSSNLSEIASHNRFQGKLTNYFQKKKSFPEMTNVLSWTKSVSLLQSPGARPATRVTSLTHCLALRSHHPVISKTNSCQLIMLVSYVPSFILFYFIQQGMFIKLTKLKSASSFLVSCQNIGPVWIRTLNVWSLYFKTEKDFPVQQCDQP